MSADNPLTCSTCKYKGFSLIGLPKCRRPNRAINPVTGKQVTTFCSNQRDFTLSDCCGPSGKFHSSIFPIKVTS